MTANYSVHDSGGERTDVHPASACAPAMPKMPCNYRCVTSLAEVRSYLGDAPIVAFDYETAPDLPYRDMEKSALDPAMSHICTLSLSVAEGSGIMIPAAHRTGPNMPPEDFDALLHEFLLDPHRTKIAHNLAFEAMFSYARGIIIAQPVYDTIAAAQLTLKSDYEFRTMKDSGLKTLAAELCGEPLPSFTAVTAGAHFDTLDPLDPETVRYSCADADFALRLYRIFNTWFDRYLPAHRRLVEQVESPTAVYLGLMKFNGVPIDLPLLEEKKQLAGAELARLRGEIASYIGPVNIGSNCSTDAFKKCLYQGLGLPVLRVTARSRAAADDATMILLREWCAANRPELTGLFDRVQEFRKWQKLCSTYLDGYRKYINPVTGRIHPSFYALSTDTGRFSCSGPNLQNAPRKTNDPIGIRALIRAPAGHIILSCDYSQIELRVGAESCGDKTMMETYRTGGDIHAATTSVLFGIPYAQAKDKNDPDYKERRTIAKNINFGVFYGLFPAGVQRTLKFKAGVEKSMEECEAIIHALHEGYPALAVWQQEAIAFTRRTLYAETRLGRRRYLPDIRSDDWNTAKGAERCALNTPIQGTAADIIKLSLGRILAGLPERPWLKPILQIHDELSFIIPEEKLPEAVRFVRKCMEEPPFEGFSLPLVAEAAAGPDFGHMEELDDA